MAGSKDLATDLGCPKVTVGSLLVEKELICAIIACLHLQTTHRRGIGCLLHVHKDGWGCSRLRLPVPLSKLVGALHTLSFFLQIRSVVLVHLFFKRCKCALPAATAVSDGEEQGYCDYYYR